MPRMTGGQALVRALESEGVEVLFGLPGDQIMHAYDALYDSTIRVITTRHEQGTTYLADGYARASGKPGVSLVVPGVGVYNAASGLATAYATSSQVLQVAGQVNRHGIGKNLGLLHDVHDQLDVVKPITKWQKRVLTPPEIPGAVHEAFRQMRTGRPRPTHVEVPPEGLAEEAEVEIGSPLPASPLAPEPARVRAVANALRASRRPLLFVGGGVVLGNASTELVALAELLQTAVVTTREGKGAIDERHALSVGTMWVNKRLHPILNDADLILAIGTRFLGTGVKPDQHVIHIDVDCEEIGKAFPGADPLLGDAKLTLRALLAELDGDAPRPSRASELRAARRAIEEELCKIGPAAAIVEKLRAAIPEDGIVVSGTTTVGYMSHMYYKAYAPRTYLSSSYMGTLGFAFPTALGAKVGQPERPVFAISGDGGFLFCASELATAVQFGIPTITLVFDDGAYGNSNRDQRERFGGREIGTLLRNPDFAALARSFGADGIALHGPGDLVPAIREALAGGRPSVIACPIERLPSPF
jgi:acetolactate synthase-1/2/3 large subunit